MGFLTPDENILNDACQVLLVIMTGLMLYLMKS